MDEFNFETSPSHFWGELCDSENNFFNSESWQNTLNKAFDCQTVYGWNKNANTGTAITIFKAGPFRIGYMAFPVGGIVGDSKVDNNIIKILKKSSFPVRLDLLRLQQSGFCDNTELDYRCIITPETAIVDLGNWDHQQFPKLNRDIKKSLRSNIKLEEAKTLIDSKICYCLFKETIHRHYGNLRYNPKYFDALLELSTLTNNLRILLAKMDDNIAGFIVVALHGDSAYYLHGAIDQSLKKYGVSDRLLFESIIWSRENNMKYFNLMSSPPNQSTLVRYKEKWGGTTKDHKTYDIPIKRMASGAFKGTMLLYSYFNKYFR